MSLREELNRAIDAADHYDRHGVMPTWARMALTKFVGNHGQALLDALEDGDRLDWLFKKWSGEALRKIGVVYSEPSEYRQAIDAAIKVDV